ncbi:hypothetical protein [Pelotomaculum sp. FP]|uniref:hypothetical protein n=1 Tax=Pelotomaculum sp. FP TaxID=261474 RepID=UPI001292AAB0|nr:hypothetical protein [Pelotomaculum sp. FP]
MNCQSTPFCFPFSTQEQAKEDVTITPLGTSIPTQVWNIVDNGRYNFSGVSYGYPLYSNYKFIGKTNYTIRVQNNAATKLIVTVKSPLKTYKTQTIWPDNTSIFSASGMSSTTQFYLRFEGEGGTDMDFSGYIE